tara:strand:+ start:64 stop:570 length:507 start_codon:yes stop_codon:yes gene_type:complete
MTITFHPDGRVEGSGAANFGSPGNIINVTHGQYSTTGLTTQSTSFVTYAASNITVTKLRGPGNVSGGSYLLILAGAWIEFESNSKHLAYSIMRDGTEVSGKSKGLGNLYSASAGGYQSSADMKWMDTANLNAGNYVYSVCICNTNGGSNVQVGNAHRLSTWQILEVAT